MLSCSYGHHGFAAHDFEAFADSFFAVLLELAKIVDVAGELTGFAPKTQDRFKFWEMVQPGDATLALTQVFPQFFGRVSQRADDADPGNDNTPAAWVGG